MSNVACPHYLPPGAGETGQCRGCGAIVGNPANANAQARGLVTGTGSPVTVSQHNSNPGATKPKR